MANILLKSKTIGAHFSLYPILKFIDTVILKSRLVMGLSHFRLAMDTGPYEITNIDGSTGTYEMEFDPFDLPAAHIYKIGEDGKVHEIDAMGFTAPYNAPTIWE